MLTDWASNQILDFIFGGKQLYISDILYVGMSKNEANQSGFISEPNERVGYYRVPILNNKKSWPDAIGGIKQNGHDILFGAMLEDVLIKSVFVSFSANNNSSIICMGNLPMPTLIKAGVAPRIDIGVLKIQIGD